MSREFYPILAKPYRAKQLLGIIAEQFRLNPLPAETEEPEEETPSSAADRSEDEPPWQAAAGR
jgi:hypothetical protein